jgi:hypothetical protein
VGFFPGVKIEDVKRDVEGTLHNAAAEMGLGLQVSHRGFHADGAVLLSEYVDRERNVKDDSGTDRSLQREFVETMQRCHGLATSSNGDDAEELKLAPITCTCDA